MKTINTLLLLAFALNTASQVPLAKPIFSNEIWHSVAADIDADGDKDIIFMNGNTSIAAITGYLYLFENIDGLRFDNLKLIKTCTSANSFHWFQVEDVDQDGLPDIIVNSYEKLEILKNEGDLDFQTVYTTTTGFVTSDFRYNSHSTLFYDMNADGLKDILHVTDSLMYWYENTAESFVFVEHEPSTLPLSFGALLYLDNDDYPDLVGETQYYTFNQSLGIGPGVFSEISTLSLFDPYCTHCADVNNDGFLDNVSFDSFATHIYVNNGDFTFESIEIETNYETYGLIGDYNGDGLLDMLSYGYSNFSLCTNLGNETFSIEYDDSDYGQFDIPILAADFNNDGYDDMWCPGLSYWISSLVIVGEEAISLANLNKVEHSFPNASGILQGESSVLNENELVISGGINSYLKINLNSNGVLESSSIIIEDENQIIYLMGVSDIDNDGDSDLVFHTSVENFATTSYTILENQNENYVFATSLDNNTGYFNEFSTYQHQTFLSDFDGDGLIDIFSEVQDTLGYFKNLGNFEFEYIPICETNLVSIFDYEGDGDIDVTGFCDLAMETDFCLYLNNGSGIFTYSSFTFVYPAIIDLEQIVAGDFNNDNLMDQFYSGYYGYALALNSGNNSVQLEYEISLEDPVFVSNISSNYYPNMDVIMYCTFDMGIYIVDVLTGQVTETYGDYPLSNAQNANFLDFDNDGDDDIVFFFNNNNVMYIENYMISDYNASGQIFIDANANGNFDSGEQTVCIGNILLDGDYEFYSINTEGEFQINNNGGDFQCAIQVDPSVWNFTTPSFYNISLTADNPQVSNINFGLVPNGFVQSISCDFVVANNLCNVQNQGLLTIENNGNSSTEIELILSIDPHFQFISSNPTPSLIIDNEFYFDGYDLGIGEVMTINIQFQNPDQTNIGESFQFIATGNVIVNGTALQSDIYTNTGIVQCAYDPNDKQELTTVLDNGNFEFGSDLEYLVRFQNTGNAPATNIRIDDQLSTSLDWTSLEIEASSHDYYYSITNEGLLSFYFDNINLPDSFSNEIASHGFIKYTIKPIESLEEGAGIYNTAYIYFDQNPAVITNTTQNYLYTGIESLGSLRTDILVYPNPFSQQINIQFNENNQNRIIRIYDFQGKLLFESLSKNSTLTIDTTWPASIYLLQAIDQQTNFVRTSKIIKQ